MNIVWLTWKDIKHPEAGGAELVNHELAKRLVADGHKVKMLVGRHAKLTDSTVEIDGYTVERLGNRYTVYWLAWRKYRKNLRSWADLTIEEINTVPFFSRLYAPKPRVLIVYQLARSVWFHQMIFPLSLIGYLAEYVYIWLLRKEQVVTISESSKEDLLRQGFVDDSIEIITMGSDIQPVRSLQDVRKGEHPTVLSFGSVRPMKQTLDQVKAFEMAKQSIPNLRMVIAGSTDSTYGKRVMQYVQNSRYADDITYAGRVGLKEKQALMRSSHLILVTSIKEGWGLIVTEAAAQGTPAVVYDRDGLRDSALKGEGGWLVQPNTRSLAEGIILALRDKKVYTAKQLAGWQASKRMTYDRCYADFKRAIDVE